MKVFFGLCGFVALAVVLWTWRWCSLERLWAWCGAQPVSRDPVWRQVQERLALVAQRYRVPVPPLRVLPEFAPNALVVRGLSGQVEVALTEGLVRVLGTEELEAVLALCLAHGYRRSRIVHTWLALSLLPFANLLQSYPTLVQVVLGPWITGLLRLLGGPAGVLRSDLRAAQRLEPLRLAAALQKLSVLGRKVPLRHWNFALDSLFLLSPLALDEGPFWFFLSQPSVEARRELLLSRMPMGVACESAGTLP